MTTLHLSIFGCWHMFSLRAGYGPGSAEELPNWSHQGNEVHEGSKLLAASLLCRTLPLWVFLLPDVMMPHVEVPVRQQVGCDNMVSAGCLVPTVVKSIDFIISEVWKNPFEAGQVLMQQKSSKMPRVATSYSDCDTGWWFIVVVWVHLSVCT